MTITVQLIQTTGAASAAGTVLASQAIAAPAVWTRLPLLTPPIPPGGGLIKASSDAEAFRIALIDPRVSSKGEQYAPGAVNLITAPNAIDNAAWIKNNAPTVAPDVLVAPDGTTTGDTITATAAVGTSITQNLVRGNVPSDSFVVWLLKNGAISTAAVGINDTTAGISSLGSVSCDILSGPGTIAGQPIANGCMFNIANLSATVWTQVQVTRSGGFTGNAQLSVYITGYGPAAIGDSLGVWGADYRASVPNFPPSHNGVLFPWLNGGTLIEDLEAGPGSQVWVKQA